MPAIALTPGLQLGRAVDTALVDLQQVSAAGERDVMRRVNANLHGALAHTAAIGETCMVAGAVQAIHLAEHCLDVLDVTQARAALAMAREQLTSPVPEPRDVP